MVKLIPYNYFRQSGLILVKVKFKKETHTRIHAFKNTIAEGIYIYIII